jgi:hypothetical protein
VVRVQIGYLDQHPIRIYCSRCGILFDGFIFINQSECSYSLEFNNASQVRGRPLPTPDFVIESSGELLTDKVQVYESGLSSKYLPPFIKTVITMDPVQLSNFISRAIKFKTFSKNEWPKIRRIQELWINEKHDYLAKELQKYLSEKTFPLNNELEYLRGINTITLYVFFDLLDAEVFAKKSRFVMDELLGLSSNNPTEMAKLVNYFNGCHLVHKYE